MTDHDPFLDELRQWADRAHTSAYRASDAPAGMWQRIRTDSDTTTTEGSKMNARSMPVSSVKLVPNAPRSAIAPTGTAPRRYSQLAATLAVVITLALAGLFASMQLNSPETQPEPHFAAIALQPEEAGNGVCDVEPLTVDHAIAILTDPMATLLPGEDDPTSLGYPPAFFDRRVPVDPDIYAFMNNAHGIEFAGHKLPEVPFERAMPTVNEYLDCLVTGSLGQIWRLTDPLAVQFTLAYMLPVLASEDDARALLPEILQTDAITLVDDVSFAGLTSEAVLVNPDRALTRSIISTHFVGYSSLVLSPVVFMDANGDVIAQANLRGGSVEDEGMKITPAMTMVYGQSVLDNNWYVQGFYFPNIIPEWEAVH